MRNETQVPAGWTETKLGEHLDICRNGLTCRQDANPANAIPVTRIETISEAKIDYGRVGHVDHQNANPDYMLRRGDILLSHINSVKHIGKVARKTDDRPLLHGMNLMAIRCSDQLDGGFGFYVLASQRTKSYMEMRAKKAVNQASINRKDVYELPILLPPLPEQRDIAAVLDSIDEAIERTEAVVAATERLRDALLHELLTRGVPGWHSEWKDAPGIGTIPACWDVKRLGDVCSPPKYGAGAPAQPYNPAMPRYVRITDLTEDGRLRTGDARSAVPSQVMGYELETGDLLFARSGATVGKTYLYHPQDGPCVFAGYLIRFRPLRSIAQAKFLEDWTHTHTYRRWVASMFRAGAQPNINAMEYASMRIPLPPLPEQRTIAALLSSVDATKEGSRAEVDALRSLKASASDALLTGQVRTKDYYERSLHTQ